MSQLEQNSLHLVHLMLDLLLFLHLLFLQWYRLLPSSVTVVVRLLKTGVFYSPSLLYSFAVNRFKQEYDQRHLH